MSPGEQVDGEGAALQPVHLGTFVAAAIGETDGASAKVPEHPVRHAALDAQDADGLTPLHDAAREGHTAVASLLLRSRPFMCLLHTRSPSSCSRHPNQKRM